MAKLAVTVLFPLIVKMQAPLPEHPPPDQPTNLELGEGTAFKVTDAPLRKYFEQALPQLILGGWLVTTPVPLPNL